MSCIDVAPLSPKTKKRPAGDAHGSIQPKRTKLESRQGKHKRKKSTDRGETVIKDNDDKNDSKYVELSRPSEHIECAVVMISLDTEDPANSNKDIASDHPVDNGGPRVEMIDCSTSQNDYTGPCTNEPLQMTELRYTPGILSSPLTEPDSLDSTTSVRADGDDSNDGQSPEGAADNALDMADGTSIGEDYNTVTTELAKDTELSCASSSIVKGRDRGPELFDHETHRTVSISVLTASADEKPEDREEKAYGFAGDMRHHNGQRDTTAAPVLASSTEQEEQPVMRMDIPALSTQKLNDTIAQAMIPLVAVAEQLEAGLFGTYPPPDVDSPSASSPPEKMGILHKADANHNRLFRGPVNKFQLSSSDSTK